jgi:hypothetical protein
MMYIHADESGVPDAKQTAGDDELLSSFDWIKIDGEKIPLTHQPLHTIYERCQQAKRASLRWESAFADYTAEFRKRENKFVIVRRGNGFA